MTTRCLPRPPADPEPAAVSPPPATAFLADLARHAWRSGACAVQFMVRPASAHSRRDLVISAVVASLRHERAGAIDALGVRLAEDAGPLLAELRGRRFTLAVDANGAPLSPRWQPDAGVPGAEDSDDGRRHSLERRARGA